MNSASSSIPINTKESIATVENCGKVGGKEFNSCYKRGAQIEYCSGRLAAWMVLCVDSVEEIQAIKLTK
jgi:hypothetical protein